MIKLDPWAVSKRPYALKLDSLRWRGGRLPTLDAVWFRKRTGGLAACVGELTLYGVHDLRQAPAGADALTHTVELIKGCRDSSYGGDTRTRVLQRNGVWAVETWTASQDYEQVTADRELALSMLDRVGEVPAGYDGWWAFERTS